MYSTFEGARVLAAADIAAQGGLRNEVARLVDSGCLRTTLGEHDGRIDARTCGAPAR